VNRNSLQELSGRTMHHAVRLAMQGKAMDNPMWQELNFGGFLGDAKQFVERVQAFGLTSVPLPPIVKKAMAAAGGGKGKSGLEAHADGGGGAGGGGGDGGAGAQPEAPEGIALFMGGARDHPVVIAVDDRRHRPMGMKPGETAQYDDIQQMTLMRRDGLYLLSNDNEDSEGKKAERFVSLRHVEKGKQERKPQVKQQSRHQIALMSFREKRGYVRALAQQAKDDQTKENFKHEGDTVNTELRVTKKKIEFRNGETVKAEHDKQSDKWDFKGKEHHVTSSDKHTVTTKQVAINGSTGIGLTGPTTVNGSPVATTATLSDTFVIIAELQARVAALEARLG
jgi:phage gp45-like